MIEKCINSTLQFTIDGCFGLIYQQVTRLHLTLEKLIWMEPTKRRLSQLILMPQMESSSILVVSWKIKTNTQKEVIFSH